jgi:hypothetical protein
VSKFKEIWADSQESEGNTMSKAEEPSAEWLANECIRQSEEGNYERALFLRCGEALRRLAAIEQAAEPVAWRWGVPKLKGYEWRYTRTKTKSDAIPLYTHPAPRKPMTDEQIKSARIALPFDIEDTPEPWAFREGVRAAERFHDIKE